MDFKELRTIFIKGMENFESHIENIYEQICKCTNLNELTEINIDYHDLTILRTRGAKYPKTLIESIVGSSEVDPLIVSQLSSLYDTHEFEFSKQDTVGEFLINCAVGNIGAIQKLNMMLGTDIIDQLLASNLNMTINNLTFLSNEQKLCFAAFENLKYPVIQIALAFGNNSSFISALINLDRSEQYLGFWHEANIDEKTNTYNIPFNNTICYYALNSEIFMTDACDYLKILHIVVDTYIKYELKMRKEFINLYFEKKQLIENKNTECIELLKSIEDKLVHVGCEPDNYFEQFELPLRVAKLYCDKLYSELYVLTGQKSDLLIGKLDEST
jgi:hypothetical protein